MPTATGQASKSRMRNSLQSTWRRPHFMASGTTQLHQGVDVVRSSYSLTAPKVRIDGFTPSGRAFFWNVIGKSQASLQAWSAPQKLVQAKWESLGRLSHG